MAFKVLILINLLLILLSLFSGVFFLAKDQSQQRRLAHTLTLRIILSISLFMLLIIGYFTGHLSPHGLMPL